MKSKHKNLRKVAITKDNTNTQQHIAAIHESKLPVLSSPTPNVKLWKSTKGNVYKKVNQRFIKGSLPPLSSSSSSPSSLSSPSSSSSSSSTISHTRLSCYSKREENSGGETNGNIIKDVKDHTKNDRLDSITADKKNTTTEEVLLEINSTLNKNTTSSSNKQSIHYDNNRGKLRDYISNNYQNNRSYYDEFHEAYVRCTKTRQYESAIALYYDIKNKGFHPCDTHLLGLLSICTNKEHLPGALLLFNDLLKSGNTLTETAYMALIRCYSDGEQIGESYTV